MLNKETVAWSNAINARRFRMKRASLRFLLLVLLIASAIAPGLPFSKAASTIIPGGEITVDTTWTAGNSPYSVTNNVTVGRFEVQRWKHRCFYR
jgi:hypothetical protein